MIGGSGESTMESTSEAFELGDLNGPGDQKKSRTLLIAVLLAVFSTGLAGYFDWRNGVPIAEGDFSLYWLSVVVMVTDSRSSCCTQWRRGSPGFATEPSRSLSTLKVCDWTMVLTFALKVFG